MAYSEEQIRWAVDQVRHGATCREVAKAIGCGVMAVGRWCREAGVGSSYHQADKSRRIYLARLMRKAIPDAIKHASEEFMKKLEDP